MRRLDEIARLGGGTVESYPEDVEGRKVSASLYDATVALLQSRGLERSRPLGMHHWVLRRQVT